VSAPPNPSSRPASAAEPIGGEGLLTAYFAPAYDARRRPDAEFSAPVRPSPRDPAAAPDRAGIERQPADDALAWMRPEDLFFLQVQGSGTLTFPDGARETGRFRPPPTGGPSSPSPARWSPSG